VITKRARLNPFHTRVAQRSKIPFRVPPAFAVAIRTRRGPMIPGAEQFLSDPEAVATAQNFLYGIAQNCIVGAITEWRTNEMMPGRRKRRNCCRLPSDQESYRANRTTITLSLRKAHVSKQEFDLLFPAAADQVLASELAHQIASDSYSREKRG